MKKVLLSVLSASLILISAAAFKSSITEEPPEHQKLMQAINMIVSKAYTSEVHFDDKFSGEVWSTYLDKLDPKKNVFQLVDIEQLKKFEFTIDDEINGAPITFYSACVAIYNKRLSEAEAAYKNILLKPFDFSGNDQVSLDTDKQGFAKNEAELSQRWKNELKYITLGQLVSLQSQRDLSKPKDKLYKKTDAELEQMARTKVQQQVDRMFTRLRANAGQEPQFNSFINAITATLDPHSDYLPPVDKRSFDESMSRRFYGIGAQLQEEDGNIKIKTVEPGSPASKTPGIQVNDLIIKVGQGANGEMEDISGMGISDAVKLIRGEKNTVVRLTLKKSDGTETIVSMVRDEIVQGDALARSSVINNNGHKIGYILLPGFYADPKDMNGAHCSADVAKELVKLKKENVEGIILDLRNNGGGSLSEVVKMVGLFIKDGPVVQVKGREVTPSVLGDRDQEQLYAGPLVVMINALSASASEIFAAAIQDYKRGVIIGSHTSYGKGTVQTVVSVDAALKQPQNESKYGALKVTIQKFYRVNGGSTQLKGVSSDIVLPDPYDFLKIREQDNKHALVWDQIQPVGFAYPPSVIQLEKLKQLAAVRRTKDKTFDSITTGINWFAAHNGKNYNLNLKNYKMLQDSIKAKSKELLALQKLPETKEMKIRTDEGNARIKEWAAALRKDVYVQEAAAVVNDIVSK